MERDLKTLNEEVLKLSAKILEMQQELQEKDKIIQEYTRKVQSSKGEEKKMIDALHQKKYLSSAIPLVG